MLGGVTYHDADAWEETGEDEPREPLPTIDPHELLTTLIDNTPGAVRRAPQEAMIHHVHDSLLAGSHSAVQAGTGTGKSFGYLVAALASGRRVIVSTSTKQLGDQLVAKDIPAVAEAAASIGRDVNFAILKGRANYACLSKVEDINKDAGQEAALFTNPGEASETGVEVGKDIAALMDWVKTTETGDRLDAPAVSDRAWSQFSVDSGQCLGAQHCSFAQECFAEAAKKRAHDADLTVVNHTLLANYLDLQRNPSLKTPLTDFDVLIADEAHDLEATISKSWTAEVDPKRMSRAIDAAKRINDSDTTRATAQRHVTSLVNALDALPEGPLTEIPVNVTAALEAVITEVERLRIMAKSAEDGAADAAKAGWRMLRNRLDNTAREAAEVSKLNPETHVRWVERDRDGTNPVLKGAPLSIAEDFPDAIRDWQVVLTSATLTVGGRFEPITSALGIKADSTDVGSPFNYAQQAMIYVPDASFPAPVGQDRQAHTEAVLDTIPRLVEAAGGRTLALFTTVKAAKAAAEHLRGLFPHLNILCHGDAPTGQLVEQFKADETSVLCGTRGLFQGADIAGPSLSCLILDKLPFPMYNDPLLSARARKVEEAGGNGFMEVMVANTAIPLAQAAGRLIRTSTDRGVIAVLDPRLRTKRYGGGLLRSLPPARVWGDLDVVCAALRRLVTPPVELQEAA